MKNKINFVTGETYTLAELFSGHRRIIIPDLQRDYCWGDEVHTDEKKELVSGFVYNLIQQFEGHQDDSLNLGLIYGYESPETHIQLCDGQQRITTLFLLLGMLNRKVGNNEFRQFLISDYELQDDKEPYLLYSIRESSLYFLSDLVCRFFMDTVSISNVSDISSSSWFFNEYNYDPSINSMLKALLRIDDILKDKSPNWCRSFGEFLTGKLTFLYYDMGNRRNGEETFVVINTTGEPLSATQNMKPLVINADINKQYSRFDDKKGHTLSEDWERIETWFWKNRQGDNDTADTGFNEFLRWVLLINSTNKELVKNLLSKEGYNFPVSEISFKEIYRYWECVRFLFEHWEYRELLDKAYLSPADGALIQIDCLKLLPLIAYCYNHQNILVSDRNLFRIFKFFQNLSRIDNVGKNVNDLVYDAILIGKSVTDIVELVDVESRLSSQISEILLTSEEREKLIILRDNPNHRNEIEEALWKAQDDDKIHSHKIWSGRIRTLIQWSRNDDGEFELSAFEKYLGLFDDVFEKECEGNIDPVRRALLTRGLQNYPRQFRGINYSFGWDWEHWEILINENSSVFKLFFDDLSNGLSYQEMIDKCPDDTPFSEFAKKEYLLEYCQKKNIQKDERRGWLLIKSINATSFVSVNTMHLYHYLKGTIVLDGWSVDLWEKGSECTYIENKNKDYVFDVFYYDNCWILQFFRRNSEVEHSLEQFVDETWNYTGERYQKIIPFSPQSMYTYPNVKELLFEIICRINLQNDIE